MLPARTCKVSGWSASRKGACALQSTVARGLRENVAFLPGIEHVRAIRIPRLSIEIPNVEGKKASVAIYNHLAQKYNGKLSEAAASEGLQLYAEVVEDAKNRPGAHPNIDLLLRVLSSAVDDDMDIVTISV
ncbi:hypothetical protein V8C86DRAFT_2721165 [Haematococcus lacustris]